jgi:hypothetical protein
LRLGEWSESRAFQVICETTAVVIQGRTARVHQQAFGRDKPAGIWLLFPNQHGEVAIAPRGGKPILPSIGGSLSTAQEISNRFPRDQSGRQRVVFEFRLNAPFAFAQAADQPDRRAKNRGRVPLRHPSPVWLVPTSISDW